MKTYTKEELDKLKDVYTKLDKTLETNGRAYYEKKIQGKAPDDLTKRELHMLELITNGIYKRAYIKNILNSNGIFIM